MYTNYDRKENNLDYDWTVVIYDRKTFIRLATIVQWSFTLSLSLSHLSSFILVQSSQKNSWRCRKCLSKAFCHWNIKLFTFLSNRFYWRLLLLLLLLKRHSLSHLTFQSLCCPMAGTESSFKDQCCKTISCFVRRQETSKNRYRCCSVSPLKRSLSKWVDAVSQNGRSLDKNMHVTVNDNCTVGWVTRCYLSRLFLDKAWGR